MIKNASKIKEVKLVFCGGVSWYFDNSKLKLDTIPFICNIFVSRAEFGYNGIWLNYVDQQSYIQNIEIETQLVELSRFERLELLGKRYIILSESEKDNEWKTYFRNGTLHFDSSEYSYNQIQEIRTNYNFNDSLFRTEYKSIETDLQSYIDDINYEIYRRLCLLCNIEINKKKTTRYTELTDEELWNNILSLKLLEKNCVNDWKIELLGNIFSS